MTTTYDTSDSAEAIWRESENAAADHPVLTRQQERMLFQRIERGDWQAREEILRCNYRLVAKIAGQMCCETLPYHDAVNVGHIGLMRAAEKFDWRRGLKFSTYAINWIRQVIQRERDNTRHLIRVPIGQIADLRELVFAISRLDALGIEATDDVLAKRLGWSVAKTAELRGLAARRVQSLDESLPGDGDARTLGEVLASEVDTAEEAGAALEAELLGGALDALTGRERGVVEAIYMEERSLHDVAAELHISEGEARRIEHGARRKLRAQLGGEA